MSLILYIGIASPEASIFIDGGSFVNLKSSNPKPHSGRSMAVGESRHHLMGKRLSGAVAWNIAESLNHIILMSHVLMEQRRLPVV